jgi:hypothetical protein
MFYSFVPSESDCLEVTLNNAGTNFDAVLAVREDHCRLGPVVACNDDAAAPAAASQLSALPVVAGRTYYVVIEGYDGATGDFELTVDSASGAAWQRRLFLSDSPGPSSRHVVASTYDSARAVTVLFGGYNVSGSLDDTWEWDGRWWWERTPAEQPPKRAMAAMAYDTERRVSLLFGGQRSALPLDDTWLWDGHNWSAPSPSHVPPASSGAAMVFDSHRGVAVLFGGWGNSGALAQTWEWDGSDWQNRTPVAGDNPSPRTRAVMVYDAMRGVTLLFGGTDKVGWYGDDTWQWDGRRWHQLFPLTSPEGRERAAMVYDSHRGVAVLFGGEREEAGDDVTLRDTWEWDGTNWQEGPTPPALVPMAASGAAMAYDQLHREVLLSHGAQYDPSDGGRYTVPLAHLYRGCTSASAGR